MPAYDVIIAGAGIVGLATALGVLEQDPEVKLLILEKEAGEARHQTGNNSGVIHSGIYYKPGSLKAVNCITGYNLLLEFCRKHGIYFDICGKVIVAVSHSEVPGLNAIYERGLANGLDKIRLIGKEELKEREPHASGVKAIYVPYTGIIDYKAVAKKYAELIVKAGGEIQFSSKVKNIRSNVKLYDVETSSGSFNTKVFVNCCGLQSDEVAGLTEGKVDTRIIPFRGEYYKIRPERRHLVKNLIYPVPDPAFPFLGVHFTRMVTGEVEAGPNAVLAFKKEGYTRTSLSAKDSFRIFTWNGFYKIASKYYKTGFGEFRRSFSKKAFVKALQRLMPEITESDLIAGGAGVRAQAISKDGRLIDDFLIHENGNIINVLNAPSPAATSSIAIGKTIAERIKLRL
ncbi:MAG TPA: L-2-hydroxyglutarate oxidase [Ignavibacteria bacterium]|nr:L-2-hydroxyglutarate oxidase [Bacteroidota bacterium]HRE09921.1 L-2-hydroxyglutarate oxidase [Ignavibacteria bacterium]HRF66391.1 L-2-hydroxyglutarate oxidase [Ignavibacteria bacterium]HRJ05495.1 L-2-hydroxyglutarate oxidase [Ignavibacteria bacterium]HRJ85839.1 L-2-hydroxyglutarate oxidase [Ignavibacteria bacterium]